MTTTTKPPKMTPSEFETQVLFPEAHQRRHRRWAIGIALLAVLATVVALLVSSSSKTMHPSSRHVGLARWTPLRGTRTAAPAIFVAGDGRGGVGVYSTDSGHLIRTLSPQRPGALTSRSCSPGMVAPCTSSNPREHAADKSSVPQSRDHGTTVVISDPGRLALAPSPSPSSDYLAWVGVTCGSTGATTSSSLYVTDLATHATRDLGRPRSSSATTRWHGVQMKKDSPYGATRRWKCLTLRGNPLSLVRLCRLLLAADLRVPPFSHKTGSQLFAPATAPPEPCVQAAHSCSTSAPEELWR